MAFKKYKWIWIGIAVALVGLVIWIAWANTALELNTYTVSSSRLPESFDGYRIAHISDLHNTENDDLLDMLRQAHPDMIAITGDLIDSRDTHVEIALEFAREAVKIAPCYYVTGNHEARVSEYIYLKAGLEAAGVTVLANDRTQISLEGAAITVMGVNDPCFRPDYLSGNYRAAMAQTLTELTAEEAGFTVLLSHRPELFEIYADNRIDLTLSGHAHGGQFRLPFIGGLFAPNQGFFPKYDAGLFTQGLSHMIVSRGIGNSSFPFRINNRPELVLIELKTAEE